WLAYPWTASPATTGMPARRPTPVWPAPASARTPSCARPPTSATGGAPASPGRGRAAIPPSPTAVTATTATRARRPTPIRPAPAWGATPQGARPATGVAGACVGTNPVVCTASDQCHGGGACNPATGTCSNPAKPDGSDCDDGNACTQTDTCQAGACVGTNPVVCAASDQCHTAGTCNPATGACSNPAKPDGASCNEGNACTRTDTCQAGACVGTNPVVCASSDLWQTAGP